MATGGCRGKSRISVFPVRGQVVYNGQGVSPATVIFFAVDPANEEAKKLHPYAYVEEGGHFQITTYVDGDGAPPGKYRVSIIAPASEGTSKKDKPVEVGSSAPAVRVSPAVAAKYANVDTSGIEVTIAKGENNLEPFVLSMGTGRGPQSAASGNTSSISSEN
jgi:hypothetical protein